jgi:sugar/nucleoside kinase (ribokinase family)
MLDVLATGYPSLDHIVSVSRVPHVGETALLNDAIDPLMSKYGGCGANVAVGLQKLGYETGMAMVLGADPLGERYHAYLLRQGIDCRNLLHLSGKNTSASYLFRAPDGEVVNFFYPGAADAWAGTLSLKGLTEVRWGLVTVGYAPYNRAFVERLRASNIPIIWQLKPDVAAYPKDTLAFFVDASRIIFCNRFESQYLAEGTGVKEVKELLERNVEMIILTLGDKGSQVFTRKGDFTIPAVPCKVVDTNGAGDAYTTGFLGGYWRGYDADVCGRLGAACAAFTIESVGCQTNQPDWNRLTARYQDNFGKL